MEVSRLRKQVEEATLKTRDLEYTLLAAETERNSLRSTLEHVSPALSELTSFYKDNFSCSKSQRQHLEDRSVNTDNLVEFDQSLSPITANQTEINDIKTVMESSETIESPSPKIEKRTPLKQRTKTPLKNKFDSPIPETRVRPKRKAAPSSLVEPSVKTKLRKGDPTSFSYLESINQWGRHPPRPIAEEKENLFDNI
ncbi:hypothetical protein GEMRC1_008685 [Eukaryota sp. GEM-RC1]